MRRTVLLAVLLLCTCLWICSCDAPSEILTVEMHDPYLSDHPMLVSVIFPAETAGEMPQFQIGGDQYTVQRLPTDDDPRFHLRCEDGAWEAHLYVNGFYDDAAVIMLQMLPVPGSSDANDDRYHYMEYLWTSEAEPFLPLQKWLETRNIINIET